MEEKVLQRRQKMQGFRVRRNIGVGRMSELTEDADQEESLLSFMQGDSVYQKYRDLFMP